MPLNQPDEFKHNNDNKAIVDNKNVRGASFFKDTVAQRDAIPLDKRGSCTGYILGTDDEATKGFYAFIGTNGVSDVEWRNVDNWEFTGGGSVEDTTEPLVVPSSSINVSNPTYEVLQISFDTVTDFGGGNVKEYIAVLSTSGGLLSFTKTAIDGQARETITIPDGSFPYGESIGVTIQARDAALNTSSSTPEVSHTTLAEPTVGAVSLSLGYFDHKEINLSILGGNGGQGNHTYTLKYKLVGTHTSWQNLVSFSNEMIGYSPEENDGTTPDTGVGSEWRSIKILSPKGNVQYDFLIEVEDSLGNRAQGELEGFVETPYLLYTLTSTSDYTEGNRSTGIISSTFIGHNNYRIFKNGLPLPQEDIDRTQYHGNGTAYVGGNSVGDVYDYVADYSIRTTRIVLNSTRYSAFVPKDNSDLLTHITWSKPLGEKITLSSGFSINVFNVDDFPSLEHIHIGGSTILTSNDTSVASKIKYASGTLYCLDFRMLANCETYTTRGPNNDRYNELNNIINELEGTGYLPDMSAMTNLINLGTRGGIAKLPEAYNTLKNLSIYGVVNDPDGLGRTSQYTELEFSSGHSFPTDFDYSSNVNLKGSDRRIEKPETLPASFSSLHGYGSGSTNPYADTSIPTRAQELCNILDKINRDYNGDTSTTLKEWSYGSTYSSRNIRMNEILFDDSHVGVTTNYRDITGSFTGKTFETIMDELKVHPQGAFTIDILANADQYY